ncbi:hypothetical protein JJL56_09675 [Azospirillum sp. YIM DDC1]|uniref:DUF4175 domain-containing protein n=1 Tax=Azospirillum aestuarii TaxID=2802052 RepID=A0ABS1HWI1_9PROT|nr:hypothetical protein [Azospirillum aestuarii]MBK3775321.1 hypothetical protein [Azospirillum brasilense]MBK4719139.1 hypothetical protein [Azospirillum aestuarii]
MYYSEMSGPTGTTSTVLQQANNAKKATESKAADGAKAAAATTDAAAPAKSASPAYTISQSMENLLDNLSGKKPAAAGADGANAGAAGDAAGGGKTGAQAMADRAKEAERIMSNALEQSKGLAGLFEKAIDNMAGDLGSLLGGLGMSDDDVKGAVGDFGSTMKDKLKSMDFSQMGMSMEEARSQWSIESRGMELTIQDGDKSVRISFAKSTLDFTREDRGLSATLNADGSGSAMFSAATTKVSGKATGMIVRSEGFSDDEIKGVLEKLNGMAAKGGMSGLGALTPTKSADGVMHLNLDLSQPIAGLTDGSSAKTGAAADTSQKVDIKA